MWASVFQVSGGLWPKGFFFGCGLFQRKCVICIVSNFIGAVSVQYAAFLEIFEEESEQREGDMIHFTCLPELGQFLQFDF